MASASLGASVGGYGVSASFDASISSAQVID
jgi:hypothetical protein